MYTDIRLWILFFFFCLASLGFLVYSVVNREKLEITIKDPKIIVEFALFILFGLLAVLFYFHS